ncbi:fatty acid hydroxylase [Candidatus Nomurabacteria bacterium]|nr:fatty acid hydroxylase [Candidatus Nomurabacteria bacterium]
MILFLLVGFIVGMFVDSFFEWTLHRYVMHKPVKIFGFTFTYAFEAHAKIHHREYGSERNYHLIDENKQDKQKIPMAWWNGPVLIMVCQYPFLVTCLLVSNWWLLLGSITAGIAYYSMYEYLHWCMHLPKSPSRRVERIGIFFRLNGHHLLHHRYMHRNFNVVLPLADWCLHTLLVRSPVSFSQPTPSKVVPNVQPKLRVTN